MAKKKRDTVKALLSDSPREGVLVQGWVRTRRDSKGGFSFIEVNDGSCLKSIQIIADHKLDSYKDWNQPLTTGSCVSIHGNLVASQGKGQSVEVQAASIEVHGPADPES